MADLRIFFLCLLLHGASPTGSSQTTLEPGDIVVLGMAGDTSFKTLLWTSLVNLSADTAITFTDAAWTGENLRFSEGAVTYTVGVDGLTAGTLVVGSGASNTEWLENGPAWSAPVPGFSTSMNFSTSGDQVLVFEGSPQDPRFLFALNGASTGFSDPVQTDDPNRTALPAGLMQGIDAVAVGSGPGDESEYDNVWYAGPVDGNRATLLAAIVDPSNWVGDNSVFLPLTKDLNVEPTGNHGGPAQLRPISVVQGTTAVSPWTDANVIVEAVVTADLRKHTGALVLEEELRDRDEDPDTSEGIMAAVSPAFDATVGTTLRIEGVVAEKEGVTWIEPTENGVTLINHSGELPPPATMTLPFPEPPGRWLERFESMRLIISNPLYVSDTGDLLQNGQITLTSRPHTFVSTHLFAPGSVLWRTQEDLLARDQLVLDDGSPNVNLAVPPYLTSQNTLRHGDEISGITGIVLNTGDRLGLYPAPGDNLPTVTTRNRRPNEPPQVGGTLRVCFINAFNYFNGNGSGAGFPTNGAKSASEFQRQRDKLAAAILAVDADIVALSELENDGFENNSAIADLTKRLNRDSPVLPIYDFIKPEEDLGFMNIANGIVFRRTRVTVLGKASVLRTGSFASRNRPVVAQAFTETASGEKLVVAVCHLRSRLDTGNPTGLDRDQGDGQSSWNATRTRAARELAEWLGTDPTSTNTPRILVGGDFNCYPFEDPVTTMSDAGFQALLPVFHGWSAYSFVYLGRKGTLDHVFASPNVSPLVTGAAAWHINAAEPEFLDYHTDLKGEWLRRESTGTAYRSSDHDPVLIGLDLRGSRIDSDGDGFSDRHENLIGTNPGNAGSAPVFTMQSHPNPLIRYHIGPFRTVDLEQSTDLQIWKTWGTKNGPGTQEWMLQKKDRTEFFRLRTRFLPPPQS